MHVWLTWDAHNDNVYDPMKPDASVIFSVPRQMPSFDLMQLSSNGLEVFAAVEQQHVYLKTWRVVGPGCFMVLFDLIKSRGWKPAYQARGCVGFKQGGFISTFVANDTDSDTD